MKKLDLPLPSGLLLFVTLFHIGEDVCYENKAKSEVMTFKGAQEFKILHVSHSLLVLR